MKLAEGALVSKNVQDEWCKPTNSCILALYGRYFCGLVKVISSTG
jgi:hypothetical protein